MDACLSLLSTGDNSDVSKVNDSNLFWSNSPPSHVAPCSSTTTSKEGNTTNQMKCQSLSISPANYIGLLEIHQSQLFQPPGNKMARRINEQFANTLKHDILDNFELWQQKPLSGVIDTNQCKDSGQYSAKRLPKYKIYVIDGNDTLWAYRELYRETGDKRFETLKIYLYAGLTDVECLSVGITENLSPKTQGPTDLEKICFCRKLLYAMNSVPEDQSTPPANKMWTDRVHRIFNLKTKSQQDGMATIKKIAKFDKEQWDLLYKFYVQNPTFKARRFDVLNGVDQATKFQLIRELGTGEITFIELRERAQCWKTKESADILTIDARSNLNITCQSLVNFPVRAIKVKYGRNVEEEISSDELIKAIKEIKRQRALTNSSDDVAGEQTNEETVFQAAEQNIGEEGIQINDTEKEIPLANSLTQEIGEEGIQINDTENEIPSAISFTQEKDAETYQKGDLIQIDGGDEMWSGKIISVSRKSAFIQWCEPGKNGYKPLYLKGRGKKPYTDTISLSSIIKKVHPLHGKERLNGPNDMTNSSAEDDTVRQTTNEMALDETQYIHDIHHLNNELRIMKAQHQESIEKIQADIKQLFTIIKMTPNRRKRLTDDPRSYDESDDEEDCLQESKRQRRLTTIKTETFVEDCYAGTGTSY